MNLDCEMLLGGIEPHLEYSVVEMDIWPQIEVISVSLEVLMEFVPCEEKMSHFGRREAQDGHHLNWNVGDELLVG